MPDFNLAVANFQTLVGYILSILDILIPILEGLAFIFFFWGLSKFILNSGKPEEIKKGRTYMFWGILALFALLTYSAIAGWISNELKIGTKNPTVNGILLPTGK